MEKEEIEKLAETLAPYSDSHDDDCWVNGFIKGYQKAQEEKIFCAPPNITECKQAIYPDYDCNKCKWKY